MGGEESREAAGSGLVAGGAAAGGFDFGEAFDDAGGAAGFFLIEAGDGDVAGGAAVGFDNQGAPDDAFEGADRGDALDGDFLVHRAQAEEEFAADAEFLGGDGEDGGIDEGGEGLAGEGGADGGGFDLPRFAGEFGFVVRGGVGVVAAEGADAGGGADGFGAVGADDDMADVGAAGGALGGGGGDGGITEGAGDEVAGAVAVAIGRLRQRGGIGGGSGGGRRRSGAGSRRGGRFRPGRFRRRAGGRRDVYGSTPRKGRRLPRPSAKRRKRLAGVARRRVSSAWT